MKKNLFICGVGIMISLFLYQSLYSQRPTQFVRDTIENEIRNQFATAVNTAVSDQQTYRAIFKNDATVKTESSMYTIPGKVDSICIPAFDVYKSDKVQVVINTVDVSTINQGFQTIRLITIETDTTHGVPIANHSPAPKHMEMNIEWILEDNVWLIRNVNRYLTR